MNLGTHAVMLAAAHVDDAHAVGFVEGTLTEAEAAEVEAHVDACGECRRHLVELVRARTGGQPSTPPEQVLSAGALVGRYRIERVLGTGAMGVVYAAYDGELRREVALKVVRAHAHQDRLVAEAHALARLRHPNVVTVHDVGTASGRVYIVMELVQGTTLREHLLKKLPERTQAIEALFAQAARGLAAAHAAGLVHRDFKPDNVLVGDDGRVVVTDFGLARVDADDDRELVGTPAYLAPEVFAGRAADARSDQFAFMVALFEAFHGHRPFTGSTSAELAKNVAAGNLVPGNRPVRRAVGRLMERGLAVDPAARHADLTAIANALGKRTGRAVPLALAGTAILGAAIAFAATRSHDGPSCRDSVELADEVWTSATRTKVVSHFTGLRPQEGVMIEGAVRAIDTWTAAWSEARRGACYDDTPLRSTRLGCLDQALGELRAQISVWQETDGEGVDRALAAALALPSPSACSTRASGPVDPWIGGRIASANALARSGQHARARAQLEGIIATAEATGKPQNLAVALLAVGSLEQASNELDGARRHLQRAAREAGTAADDAVLFDALVAEAMTVIDQGRPLDSLGMLSAAEAFAVRAKLDREETIARHRGAALTAAGRGKEAIRELERGLALATARSTRDPGARADVAAVLGGLASAHIDLYQYAPAKELLLRCLAIEQAVFGPNHPEVGKTLHDLAIAEARLGDFAGSLAHLGQARRIIVATYGERHMLVGSTDLAIANTLMQSGKHELALPQYERAIAELSAALPGDHLALAGAEGGIGVLYAQMDNCKAALPHYARELAILTRIGRVGTEVPNALVNQATCLYDTGKLVEARRGIERALALFDEAGMPALDHAEAWAVLSAIEWDEGHHTEARQMAQRAADATAGVDRPDARSIHEFVTGELAAWARTK